MGIEQEYKTFDSFASLNKVYLHIEYVSFFSNLLPFVETRE